MMVTRMAGNQGRHVKHLKLAASTASTGEVNQLLKRMGVSPPEIGIIPCCTTAELPELGSCLTAFIWAAEEASATKVEKGKEYGFRSISARQGRESLRFRTRRGWSWT